MRKKFKKTLSLIMSLMMIMSIFAGLDILSFAEDDILNYLTYEINDGEVTITDCDESISGDVVLPDTIEGYPVTVIGDYAFSSRRNIESITLPEGLISICNKAFFECDNLTEIEIPDSVELIGEFALGYYLKKDFVNGKIVDVNAVKKDFVIKATVGSVAEAYANDNNIIFKDKNRSEDDILNYLTYEIKNDNVSITGFDKAIGDEIIIPDTIQGYPVTEVYLSDFSEFNNVESIYFSENIKKISFAYDFKADKISAFYVGSDNMNFSDDSGVLYNKDKTELIRYPGGKPITIYEIPTGVETISAYAFFGSKNLTEIKLPESVKRIKEYAFADCVNLEKMNMPDSIEYIESYILDNTAYFNNAENWDKDALYLGNFLIRYSGKNNYAVKDGTLIIAEKAFFECRSIKEIKLPDSIRIIGSAAFAYCEQLESMTIPSGVKIINISLFNTCKNLKSVTIPVSVNAISDFAFDYCYDLETIYYCGTNEQWESVKIGWYNNALNTANVVFDYKITEQPTEEPPIEEPPVDNPPVDNPPVEEPPVEDKPPVDEPPVEEPPVEEPPVEKPADDGKLDVKGEGGIVTDFENKISQIGKEETVTTLSEMIKNENFKIVDKNGKALTEKDLVGTGSKIQILDSDGKVLNEYTVLVPTDIDGNGKTSAADARLALRNAAKLDTLEGVYAMAADVTGDGKINASDARKILRISAGLEK